MAGKRVLIISADQFEDTELLCPMNRLLEAGCSVDIAAPNKGKITGKKGYAVQAHLSVKDLPEDPALEYDLLLLPGGKAPAQLRQIDAVLAAARRFDAAQKPIAAICHGPQVLISAGLMQGKTATSYTSVAQELKEAGASYVDEEVVVDGSYIFSRNPNDIPAFNRELMKKLQA
jgi:protease I